MTMTNRACIACGEIYNGPLACPACGEPGEPLDPSPQEQALLSVLALTFQGIRLDHLRETSQTITIERPGIRVGQARPLVVTVAVSEGAVVDALDEWGAPVALTHSETAEALALAAAGVDETGR